MTEQGKKAAALQLQMRRGVRGAQAELGRLGAQCGIKNESATASMDGRDDVRDFVIDGMHTVGVAVGRVRDCICGERTESLTKSSIATVEPQGTATRHSPAPPASAPPGRKRKAVAGSDQQGDQTWPYLAVVAHRNTAERGSTTRSMYQVQWEDGTLTWEDADQFLHDARQSESFEHNVVTAYESALMARQLGVEGDDAVQPDYPRWAAQLRLLAIPSLDREKLDRGLNTIPFNPKLFPKSARNPLCQPWALTTRDVARWGESFAEYQLRGQWREKEQREPGRIIRQFLAVIRRLMARSVSEREIQQLEIDVPVALSELVRHRTPPTHQRRNHHRLRNW